MAEKERFELSRRLIPTYTLSRGASSANLSTSPFKQTAVPKSAVILYINNAHLSSLFFKKVLFVFFECVFSIAFGQRFLFFLCLLSNSSYTVVSIEQIKCSFFRFFYAIFIDFDMRR